MYDEYPVIEETLFGYCVTALHGVFPYRCTDFHDNADDAWTEWQSKQIRVIPAYEPETSETLYRGITYH